MPYSTYLPCRDTAWPSRAAAPRTRRPRRPPRTRGPAASPARPRRHPDLAPEADRTQPAGSRVCQKHTSDRYRRHRHHTVYVCMGCLLNRLGLLPLSTATATDRHSRSRCTTSLAESAAEADNSFSASARKDCAASARTAGSQCSHMPFLRNTDNNDG